MVESVSQIDDALAWFCLCALIDKVNLLKPVPPAEEPASNSLQALQLLPRGVFLATLAMQLGTVNPSLFGKLQQILRELILNEPNNVVRDVVMKALFETLNERLDLVKKDQGIKWFLALRKDVEKLETQETSARL